MDAVIFIGVNKHGSSRDAVKAAKDLGYYTFVLTHRAKQIIENEAYPEVDEMILIEDMQRMEFLRKIIKHISKQHDIKGILSFVDNFVTIAHTLSQEIVGNAFSIAAISKMEDKIESRIMLSNSPYNISYKIISNTFNHNLPYPVIIKNPRSSGSHGVFIAHNDSEYRQIIDKLTTPELIVEEYVDGTQYIAEVIVVNSKAYVVAIIKQEINTDYGFVISGYQFDPKIQDDSNVKKMVDDIVTRLAMTNGNFHVEYRISKNGYKIIELNPRVSGGAINQMIEFATGINIAKETIKLLVDKDIELSKNKIIPVYTRYLLSNHTGKLTKITGRKKARNIDNVLATYFRPKRNANINYPYTMSERYGYVITTGESIIDAINNGIQAMEKIKFHLD